MTQKLRIVVSADPDGPWSPFAGYLEAGGAEALSVPLGAGEAELPEGFVPDGLITTPAAHQRARFDQLDLDLWHEVADHELDGRFRIGQAVARRMLGAGGGAILHLVAEDGLPGGRDAGSATILSYASAGLSRGIALDLKDMVRSNVLALRPERAALEAAAVLALFLCSAEGRGISGQIAAISPEQLQLFAQSRPLRVAHRDTGWDEASLAGQVRRWSAFLPGLIGEDGL